MGYTHYWTFKKPKSIKSRHAEIESRYQLAMRQCQRIVKAYQSQYEKGDDCRLSGPSAHTRVNDYLGVKFNGCRGNDHEDFVLADHWSSNSEFNFCKTARKPYDQVVIACLITLHHYLGDNLVDIGSDGYASEWVDGLDLAKRVLRIKALSIPKTIERQLKVVSE